MFAQDSGGDDDQDGEIQEGLEELREGQEELKQRLETVEEQVEALTADQRDGSQSLDDALENAERRRKENSVEWLSGGTSIGSIIRDPELKERRANGVTELEGSDNGDGSDEPAATVTMYESGFVRIDRDAEKNTFEFRTLSPRIYKVWIAIWLPRRMRSTDPAKAFIFRKIDSNQTYKLTHDEFEDAEGERVAITFYRDGASSSAVEAVLESEELLKKLNPLEVEVCRGWSELQLMPMNRIELPLVEPRQLLDPVIYDSSDPSPTYGNLPTGIRYYLPVTFIPYDAPLQSRVGSSPMKQSGWVESAVLKVIGSIKNIGPGVLTEIPGQKDEIEVECPADYQTRFASVATKIDRGEFRTEFIETFELKDRKKQDIVVCNSPGCPEGSKTHAAATIAPSPARLQPYIGLGVAARVTQIRDKDKVQAKNLLLQTTGYRWRRVEGANGPDSIYQLKRNKQATERLLYSLSVGAKFLLPCERNEEWPQYFYLAATPVTLTGATLKPRVDLGGVIGLNVWRSVGISVQVLARQTSVLAPGQSAGDRIIVPAGEDPPPVITHKKWTTHASVGFWFDLEPLGKTIFTETKKVFTGGE
jgi:hypothetical protein